MALNISTFKTRTLSAIFFVIIMLAGLLINKWSFFILFSLIHFGCWIEYQKLVALIDKEYLQITPFHKYGVMVTGYGFMLWMLDDSYRIFNFRLHELGWWILIIGAFVLPLAEVLLSKKLNPKLIAHSFLGLLYISLSWGLMMDIYSFGMMMLNKNQEAIDFGVIIPLGIISSIWINDTMAYIVGSLIGKTPFSKISPKKTWEGTIGGMILCIITISLLGKYSSPANYYAINIWIGIATIAAIFGTLGDLLESKLKRLANVKDSGNIMPGHGGFLDRFDSLLLATPIVWLFLKIFL